MNSSLSMPLSFDLRQIDAFLEEKKIDWVPLLKEDEVVDLVTEEDVERTIGYPRLAAGSVGPDGEWLVGASIGTSEMVNHIKNYQGMGFLEAMTKGSNARYLGDTTKVKIVQGIVRAVKDKGSVLKFIPSTMQAVKQGFRDLGASSLVCS